MMFIGDAAILAMKWKRRINWRDGKSISSLSNSAKWEFNTLLFYNRSIEITNWILKNDEWLRLLRDHKEEGCRVYGRVNVSKVSLSSFQMNPLFKNFQWKMHKKFERSIGAETAPRYCFFCLNEWSRYSYYGSILINGMVSFLLR